MAPALMKQDNPIPVTIRPFRKLDQAQCQTLFVEGLITGRIADNDTGFDISDIESAYMRGEGSHFWVAVNPQDQVVGMIGVLKDEHEVGEIRRLRVRVDHRRRGIGSALMETAIRFCRQQHYLKITLDTFMERQGAIKLFDKFHFAHSKTRKVGEKELLYFYLDLYSSEKRA